MSEHLTPGELEQYVSGSAAPVTLLSWDDHLAECPECRNRISVKPQPIASRMDVDPTDANADEPHLTYEQLAAKADGLVPEPQLFTIQSHLNQCESCREELADLVAIRRGDRKTSSTRFWLIAAAVAAILLPAISYFGRNLFAPTLDLPSAWSSADRTLVEQSIEAGKLPFTAPPSDLSSKTGTLLGASRPNPFSPLSPVSVIVEPIRPIFHWQILPGATAYRVEVYDSSFHLVANSRLLTGTAWTAPEPLERGELYHWQVTALWKGTSITVPSPPAPDAVFRVLDTADEQRIQAARASGPMGHLLAAVIFSRSGMKSEAVQELHRLPPGTQRMPQIKKIISTS